MHSGRWREEATLFDPSNTQGSVQLWYGWGGGSHSQCQAWLMAGSRHCFSHASLLKDTKWVKLKASEMTPNIMQKVLNSNYHLNHQKLLSSLCKWREAQELVGQPEAAEAVVKTPTLRSCGVYSQLLE